MYPCQDQQLPRSVVFTLRASAASRREYGESSMYVFPTHFWAQLRGVRVQIRSLLCLLVSPRCTNGLSICTDAAVDGWLWGDSKWLRRTKLLRSDHPRSAPPSCTPRSKRVGTTWVIEQVIELGIFGKGRCPLITRCRPWYIHWV